MLVACAVFGVQLQGGLRATVASVEGEGTGHCWEPRSCAGARVGLAFPLPSWGTGALVGVSCFDLLGEMPGKRSHSNAFA